jgi:hypothetical protein
MTTPFRWFTARWRWLLTPVAAFVALVCWGFASPIGAGPDDDYHLISTWCANGGSEHCEPGSASDLREVAHGFGQIFCYVQNPERSAACQEPGWDNWDGNTFETRRGNFYGEYPPVYYSTMRVLAGSDVQQSALVMRVVNAALFVALATALAGLLSESRRRTLMWGWLVTSVPLGVFIIPSNNPSGWAVLGVGSAFLALLGWFESTGRRRWAFAGIYLVAVLMAAGSRGDAAVYASGATVVVLILTWERTRDWLMRAILPAGGLVIALVFFTMAGQAGVGFEGFTSDNGISANVLPGVEEQISGSGLAAYNFLMLPFLWTGVWGSWGLGWLDTAMPAMVPWAAVSSFVAVGFTALSRAPWRKVISLVGVLVVLTALPVYVLTVGGDKVGENLQPRYLLPLVVLFGFVLVTEVPGLTLRFGRLQTATLFAALAGANLVALQVNIRRYITGADQQGLNLDAGAEWWWPGALVGPTATWILGSAAFAGLLVLLWPHLCESKALESEDLSESATR